MDAAILEMSFFWGGKREDEENEQTTSLKDYLMRQAGSRELGKDGIGMRGDVLFCDPM